METTYNKDGFVFFKNKRTVDSLFEDSLIIENSKIDHIVRYINKNNVKSIMINSNYGIISNIDFLRQIPNIESLKLLEDNINLEPINQLKKLRELRVGKVGKQIDFRNFKDLEVLGFTYDRNVELSSCKNIFWLWIDNFNENDLLKLSLLNALKYLFFYNPSIVNLNGINFLTKLQSISIDSGKKLTSLFGLAETNSSLTSIDIYNAKNLTNYSPISNVRLLKSLRLVKTGEVNDIFFLQDINNLEVVILGMKVLNGDLQIISRVPRHIFTNFPHYNLKSMKD